MLSVCVTCEAIKNLFVTMIENSIDALIGINDRSKSICQQGLKIVLKCAMNRSLLRHSHSMALFLVQIASVSDQHSTLLESV